MREVAYELALPLGLSGVHQVFHVSILKKYHRDGNYIIHWNSALLDENLSYEEEPIAILDIHIFFTDSGTLSCPCFSSCDRSRTNDG